MPPTSRMPPATCQGHDTCQLPLYCVDGRCVHAGSEGEPCWGGGVCANSTCEKTDGGLLCAMRRMVGDSCAGRDQCESGLCVEGTCAAVCR